jgi:hypothetical protein
MLRRVPFALLFLILVAQGCGESVQSTPKRLRVFITSTTYSGALDGTIGATIECGRRAVAGGLPGAFGAWIATATFGAYDENLGVGPWYTTGDALVFSNKADLLGAPKSELLDEYGQRTEPVGAWSGSDASGAKTGHDCNGWTSADSASTGTAGTAIDARWGGGDVPRSCNVGAHLICFEY